jgi:WD40 repeat protein
MRGTRQRATVILALFVSSAFGEVIFSRRVYKEHGASYQQIFIWNPADGVLKELTHSPRDHYHPTCDGRIVKFTSPSPAVTDDVKLWSLNTATGEEKVVGPAPEPQETPDSQSRRCEEFAKVGELEACGKEETLVVSRSGRQIGRFQIQVNICPIDNHGTIGKCETPIRSLDWTEDGKWLLIGEEGLNDGSGQRQDDYYLVNLATMKLNTVASASTAFWLPGRDQIVYVTPEGLAPLRDNSGNTTFGYSSSCFSIR